MKNVLVTGAAGFIGSHLAMHHLRRGDQVWGVDNFCSSTADSVHLRALTEYANFYLVEADICSPLHMWWELDMSPKLDLIYNFACPASPPKYQQMPLQTMATCVVGSSHVFDVARANGAIVVHASTSEVYGDPDRSPQGESYRGCVNSYGPRACYDEGKRAAEALCFDYHNSHNVDIRVVRIFNTYGPHMDPYDGRVVTNFIRQALRGEELTIYGSGEQTRSFCYVDDLVYGIVAMGALSHNPGVPINLGNPHEFTIYDLSRKVAHRIADTNIKALPLPKDDPTQRRPDISRARSILGWEPKVQLDEGLDRTIAYLRARMA